METDRKKKADGSKGSNKPKRTSGPQGKQRKTAKPKAATPAATPATKEAKTKKKRDIEKEISGTNCFRCGKKGHWKNECPEDSDDESCGSNYSFMTTREEDAERFYGFEICLDNGSQVNIVHPRFLTGVKQGAGSFKGADKTWRLQRPPR